MDREPKTDAKQKPERITADSLCHVCYVMGWMDFFLPLSMPAMSFFFIWPAFQLESTSFTEFNPFLFIPCIYSI